MSGMEDIIELLKERGIRDNVKVMVGGSPVSKKYADDIGADGYSVNAVEAVRVAKRITEYCIVCYESEHVKVVKLFIRIEDIR